LWGKNQKHGKLLKEKKSEKEEGKSRLIWKPITGKSFSSQLLNDERVFRELSDLLKIHIFPFLTTH
jgi:hypothetical protein